jgi:hypothetical protein
MRIDVNENKYTIDIWRFSIGCVMYACCDMFLFDIRGSIVVSIPACHAGNRGSIPRRGVVSFCYCCIRCRYDHIRHSTSNRWLMKKKLNKRTVREWCPWTNRTSVKIESFNRFFVRLTLLHHARHWSYWIWKIINWHENKNAFRIAVHRSILTDIVLILQSNLFVHIDVSPCEYRTNTGSCIHRCWHIRRNIHQ